MKTLEKDRNRRYETATELASDVSRYLGDVPILAGPPSAIYKFTKFARRNRAAMVTASLVGAALVLGLAVSTWQAVRATLAEKDLLKTQGEQTRLREEALSDRDRAFQAETLAIQQRDRALEAEKTTAEALYESDMARAISAWNEGRAYEMFNLVERHRPQNGRGRTCAASSGNTYGVYVEGCNLSRPCIIAGSFSRLCSHRTEDPWQRQTSVDT